MQNLNKVTLRSRQYWFDDGLVELLVGGLFAVLAALFWWQAAAAEDEWIMAVIMPLLILSGGLGMGWLLRTLKERFIYPRTGYVVYPRPDNKQRWRSGLLGGLFGVLFAIMITQLQLDAWVPALIGGGIGLFLFAIGFRLALLRYQVLAIWSIAVGGMVVFLNVEEFAASALTLFLVAVGMMVVGAANLWRYLSRTQPPSDNPGENSNEISSETPMEVQ